MEAKQRTRKRKQPPANPLTGIFTRQKSQIFCHNNRSGKSRPDPVRKTTSFLPKSVANISSQMGKYHKSSYSKDGGEDEDEEIYHISIKDLRARRVFSKPLVQKENSQSKRLGSPGEVESGKNLNPNLHSELNDRSSVKCGDESCGFERSGEERRSDEGLLAERYDLGANLRSTGCFDGENLNLSMASKCDSKDDVESEGLNTASPTSSIQGEDYANENRDSSMVEKLNNTAVDFMGEGTNGEKPSLPMPGKCDSMDFKNPNSSVVERGDKGVEFKEEDSNGENPNSLIVSIGTADGTGEISGCSNSEDTLDGVKEEKFDVGLDGTGRTSGYLSPNLSNRVFKGVKLNREICEGLTEENVQTTPPDAVVQIQQNGDGSALQNPNGSSRCLPKKISPTKGKKNLSDSKRNMVLKPCSRMKVFKTPNSFSYRRLLPFLLDMAKDTSSAPKATPCPKIEADVGEKPIVSSSPESIFDTTKLDEKPLTISPCLSSQEVSGSKKDEEKVSLEPNAIDLKTVLAAVETPVNCSQDKSQVNWVSPETQIENSMENDLQGGVSPGEQTAVDSINTLQDVSLIVKPDQADSSVASMGSPEALEKDANSEVPCQFSVYAEGECKTAHVEFKTGDSSISVFHSSAKLEAVVPSDFPAASLAKGILKRNPRGCRGICNCLNCASFRLNARKAFEFSRNQMLDAEELVFNMMKELSNLRVMLEKSVNSVKNHAILPVDQVHDACKRASNMEDIARNRLSQMSEDLYVHCRTKSLERPRVNFSANVEEKFIGKSSKQMDQNNASRSVALCHCEQPISRENAFP